MSKEYDFVVCPSCEEVLKDKNRKMIQAGGLLEEGEREFYEVYRCPECSRLYMDSGEEVRKATEEVIQSVRRAEQVC